MTHSLTLGSLLLTDSLPDDDHDFVFNVLAEGLGFGVAQGAQEVVTSLLADGDLVRTRRHGNREVTFAVEITGPSLASLAQGEAALRREIGRGNTLTWQAPDVFAAPTVFEVVASEMSQTFNDLDELGKRRTFNVTLTCSPFARSADLTTITSLIAGTTRLNVDTCDSATGWTGTRQGVATTAEGPSTIWEAGSVGIMELSTEEGFPPEVWTLTRTGSVTFSATPYLEVEATTLSAKAGAPVDIKVYADGTHLPLLSVIQLADGSGHFRMVFDASSVTSASALKFVHTSAPGYGHTWQGILVRNIARSDIPPKVTDRQLTRIINIGGTERTPCSLRVNPAAGEAMGIGIVHTSPESGQGYSPALRQRRISGNTVTTDPNAMSGAVEGVLSTPIVAAIPLTSLPEDGYSLVAMMRSSLVGKFPVVWQVRTFFAGNYLGGYSKTVPAEFITANAWTIVPLGNVTLPPVRASQEAFVQVNLSRTPVGAEVIEMDEWWAFRMGEDCALTMVNSPRAFLWLDSPDSSSPVPRIWVGNDGDRSDAHHPGAGLINQGNHVLHPDGTSVFVATAGIAMPSVTAMAHQRWHSNAAS